MADVLRDQDYARLFRAAPTPYLVLTPDLVIVEANAAYLHATGRSSEDLVGRYLFDAFPPNPHEGDDPVRQVRASLERVLATGTPDAMGVQRYDLPGRDGEEFVERYWSSLNTPVLDSEGRVVLLLHHVEDVTDMVRERQADEANLLVRLRDLREVNEQLREARDLLAARALHDPLTGLLVRSAFLEQASRALARLERHPDVVATLFIDLDHLKPVNDTHGHGAGDALIRCCAQRLRAAVRPSDVVARIGGDEFVILLENLHEPGEAVQVAERVLQALREPCRLPAGTVVEPTASIGVAAADSPRMSADTLLSRADAAMYLAKQAGRGRVEMFDEAADETFRSRARVTAEFAAALRDGELRVHYEPVVDLATGAVHTVQALLWWEHPVRGLVPAADFLDDVGDVELVADARRWVLAETCRQLAVWDEVLGERAPRSAFVEIPAVGPADRRVDEHVAATAASAGVSPDRLVLQVSDRAQWQRPRMSRDTIEGLRRLGCRLAIDHFGTGYSLTSLVDLPADVLRIDRTFVQDLGRSRESMAVVSCVLLLAHNLRKAVVAEGVRDGATLETLKDLGCEFAQGPHLAPPRSPEKLTAELSAAGRTFAVTT